MPLAAGPVQGRGLVSYFVMPFADGARIEVENDTGRTIDAFYYCVRSPSPMWYGEGDDMIFIDGEAWPPSLHGTGTEDYFNTSWCPDTLFSHPFYGYARVNDDIGWLGRTHVYRFHITDPLYFDESLRFTIEHGHNNNLTLALATVAYWYQDGPPDPFPPFPARADRAPMPMIGPVELHRWRHEWRKNLGETRPPGGG